MSEVSAKDSRARKDAKKFAKRAPGAEQGKRLEVDGASLESHTSAALRAARHLAGDEPIHGGDILLGALATRKSGQGGSAFARLEQLLPLQHSKAVEEAAGAADPFEASESFRFVPSLHASFEREMGDATFGWRGWGRDLVGTVLLTEGDAGLEKVLDESGTSLPEIRNAWFHFVALEDLRGRSESEWEARWRAAGFPVPADPHRGDAPVLLFETGGTRVEIQLARRKPWDVGVQAFALPSASRDRVAQQLRSFVGGPAWGELMKAVGRARDAEAKFGLAMPLVLEVPPAMTRIGVPPVCVMTDSVRTPELAAQAARAVVRRVAERDLQSVAIPLLGTDTDGLSASDVLPKMLDSLARQADLGLRRVVITTRYAEHVVRAKEYVTSTQGPRPGPLSDGFALAGELARAAGRDTVEADLMLAALLLTSDGAGSLLSASLHLDLGRERMAALLEREFGIDSVPEVGASSVEPEIPHSEEIIGVRARAARHSLAGVPLPPEFPWVVALATPAPGEGQAPASGVLRALEVTDAEVRAALSKVLNEVDGDEEAVVKLRAELRAPTSDRVGERSVYANDRAVGKKDKLGIEHDVEALADVMAAEKRRPPLAVGLFGDWGAGKTFFIDKLKVRLDSLQQAAQEAHVRGEETAYCKRIVHIDFNAWQYVDGNLWANLVHRIFEKLFEALFGSKEKIEEAERREKGRVLYEKLAMLQEQLAEQEVAKKAIEAERTRAEEVLDDLEKAREEAQKDLVPFSVERAVELVLNQPGIAEHVTEFRKEWGESEPADVVGDLRAAHDELLSVWGRLRRTWGWMWEHPVKPVVCVALLMLTLTATWWLPWVEALVGKVQAWIAHLGGGIGTALAGLAALGPHWHRAKSVLAKVERAQREVDRAVQEQRSEWAERHRLALARLSEIDARKIAVREEELRLEAKKALLEEEIEQIQTGARLREFIRNRSASADYRQHLGIVATIRDDFDRLGTLLTELHAEERGEQRRHPIERVVLYVDDLDRCPADRVVEVLQAVHLLLDFPLFVAVVAVDPRWLLRSLSEEYAPQLEQRAEKRPNGSRSVWVSTPQNFLEKIFQIPFTLRPMEDRGFRDLVRHLVTVNESKEPEERRMAPPPAPESEAKPATRIGGQRALPKPEGPLPPATAPEATPDSDSGTKPEPDSGSDTEPEAGGNAVASREPKKDSTDPNPKTLHISGHELRLMEQLSILIETPRTTKRLVNLYWLIRASLREHEYEEFVGTKEHPGTCKLHLFLLGIMVSSPERAEGLFEVLRRRRAVTIDEVIEALRPETEGTLTKNAILPAMDARTARGWEQLCDDMQRLREDMDLPSRAGAYLHPARRVSRFSFRPGRVFLRRGEMG